MYTEKKTIVLLSEIAISDNKTSYLYVGMRVAEMTDCFDSTIGKGERTSLGERSEPTWVIHLGFFIYYYILSYVRRGLCDPPFFFLRRALCAVQSSCTVLFRCARPTHALHASSN